MMKTRAELKREAKEALKGNWGWAIQITFLPMLLVVFINVMLKGTSNNYQLIHL